MHLKRFVFSLAIPLLLHSTASQSKLSEKSSVNLATCLKQSRKMSEISALEGKLTKHRPVNLFKNVAQDAERLLQCRKGTQIEQPGKHQEERAKDKDNSENGAPGAHELGHIPVVSDDPA